jgi:hypothetical protein
VCRTFEMTHEMELNHLSLTSVFVEVPKCVMPLFDPNMHVLLSNALLNYGYRIVCMDIAYSQNNIANAEG